MAFSFLQSGFLRIAHGEKSLVLLTAVLIGHICTSIYRQVARLIFFARANGCVTYLFPFALGMGWVVYYGLGLLRRQVGCFSQIGTESRELLATEYQERGKLY